MIVPIGGREHNPFAETVDRTPSSVALKLGNIKSFEPMRKGKGLSHASKLDQQIWVDYRVQGDALIAQAVELLFEPRVRKENPGITLGYIGRELPEGKDRRVVAREQPAAQRPPRPSV